MPDFVAGVAVTEDRVRFCLSATAHVLQAEFEGGRCTLLLSQAAWERLVQQADLPPVEEFGAREDPSSVYQISLRGSALLHEGVLGFVVVARRDHVLFALRHPLPD